MLNELERHEMKLLSVDEAGREEWHCSACGRHFLMSWPPEYSKTILVPGDEYVIHSGGKGGLRMGSPAILDADAYLPNPNLGDENMQGWELN